MSSFPRTRPTSGTVVTVSVLVLLVALAVAATALGYDLPGAAQGFVTGLYPPVAVTEEGAQIRDLYNIVFLIAAAIFLLVEGLIIWTVVRYRRKPGDDVLPAQTHGNNLAELVWTIVPTIIVHLPVRRVVADAQRRRYGRRQSADPDPGDRRPVPVAVRLPRR